jgi:hypothetical protein
VAKKESADIGREPEAMKAAYAALKDLELEEQTRVLDWLVKKLNLGYSIPQPGVGGAGALVPPPPGGLGGTPAPLGSPQTHKAFFKQKKPTNNVERIACLAYYLTHYKNTPMFKTSDLTKLNTEAAQPKMGNPSQAVQDATRAQFLTAAGGGKKQITSRGEAFVEALPDEVKVKQALAENPLARHRLKKTAKKPK